MYSSMTIRVKYYIQITAADVDSRRGPRVLLPQLLLRRRTDKSVFVWVHNTSLEFWL